MKRKNIWLKKALAVSICAAMAIQPAVTFAEDFSEESVQEATGEVDEETEIGDAAVKEPEVTEEPSEEMPEEPAEDTEIPDVVEELPENEDSQVEDLEPDAAAEGDMDDEDDPFSDGEVLVTGASSEKKRYLWKRGKLDTEKWCFDNFWKRRNERFLCCQRE